MPFLQSICASPRRFCFFLVCAVLVATFATKAVSAWNLSPTHEKITAGKALFVHHWQPYDPLSGKGDGLGPVFNADTCVHCHSQAGIGGAGDRSTNVLSFQVAPNANRKKVLSHAVHALAINKDGQESRELVQQLFPEIPAATRVVSGCSVRFESLNPVNFETINSPALFGIGLLDDVSNMTISFQKAHRMSTKIQREMSGDFAGNGIGFARGLSGGQIGKFGWKGQFATVEDFVASACAMELGLTNPKTSQPIPRQHCPDPDAKLDMTGQQLHELVCFIKSLPAPTQVLPEDPTARQRAINGEVLFDQVLCNECHVKNFGPVEGVFTDFHLYTLEDTQNQAGGYSRQEVQEEFRFPDSEPLPEHWKTPALWGVADSAPYFHDGNSPTLEAAIERHQGQAQYSFDLFHELGKDEQRQVIEFLKTLRAPTL